MAGLGNPGATYTANRHTIGYHVVDELAHRLGARFGAPRGLRAEVAEARFGPPGASGPEAPRVVLMKSRTYMNETGGSVAGVLNYFKITPDRLVVVHDELDLDPGQLRVKFGGGDNGHNGLQIDPQGARQRRLLPGPDRRRPPARSAGSGRLPAERLSRPAAATWWRSRSTGQPMPSSRSSPSASNAPRTRSTPDHVPAGPL